MTMFRFLPIVAILSVIHAATALSETLSQGLAAYDRKDYATAFPVLKEWAERGNPIAQFHFGALYDRGNGIAKDQEIAFEWFEKAAAQGHRDALFNVALSLLTAGGTEKDPDRAQLLLREVDRFGKGDMEAYLYLELWSRYGKAFERLPPALDFLRERADAGDAWAQSTHGRYIQRWQNDREEALKWAWKAADAGSMTDKLAVYVDALLHEGIAANHAALSPHMEDLAQAKDLGYGLWGVYRAIEGGGLEQASVLATAMLQGPNSDPTMERTLRSKILLRAVDSLLALWTGKDTQGEAPPIDRLLAANKDFVLLYLDRDQLRADFMSATGCLSPYLVQVYLYGIGSPQDVVEAHKFNILAEKCRLEHADDLPNVFRINFRRQQDDLARFASPDVLREARIRAAQWWLETLRKP
ncbi:tetratricopeptide repeat protein [Magnetospira sp. QH-2]|uniref:tetratricopeptide repeat protein n=1 Tax=Magnetospira sp. (strain QH-2) TaxID=1288970 RepID=UPI0003E8185F|nr:tetratricopeptide repeat protein [Magnetospira sp. QH-2]CCQ72340.1 Conserved Sel1-like TRP-containing protein of unknown function [Magnetospira sp. QH-2]